LDTYRYRTKPFGSLCLNLARWSRSWSGRYLVSRTWYGYDDCTEELHEKGGVGRVVDIYSDKAGCGGSRMWRARRDVVSKGRSEALRKLKVSIGVRKRKLTESAYVSPPTSNAGAEPRGDTQEQEEEERKEAIFHAGD